MTIERNRHPSGRIWNMIFGLACFGDGLVRFLSFGFLHTGWPSWVAREQVWRHLAAIKKANKLK